LLSLDTNKVFVCIFGEVSNKAQDNLDASLQAHKGRIEYLDLEKLTSLFTTYYPNIFIGAVELEILHNKYNELESQVLDKNKLLETTYIEPNLRMFKKSKSHLMAISKSSDQNKLGKVIGNNIFGEKETLHTIAHKALASPHKILIEGEAGSGKTILVLKLTMQIIKETIHHVNIKDKKDLNTIEVPIVLKATKLQNGTTIRELIESYYIESSSPLRKNLLIIDAIDEVDNKNKEKISLIFTSRKSAEVKERLRNYENY
jgi:predicted ATP-dependent serine protease